MRLPFVFAVFFGQWRIEGEHWRMFYFTSHKGTALAEMKKDAID